MRNAAPPAAITAATPLHTRNAASVEPVVENRMRVDALVGTATVVAVLHDVGVRAGGVNAYRRLRAQRSAVPSHQEACRAKEMGNPSEVVTFAIPSNAVTPLRLSRTPTLHVGAKKNCFSGRNIQCFAAHDGDARVSRAYIGGIRVWHDSIAAIAQHSRQPDPPHAMRIDPQ